MSYRLSETNIYKVHHAEHIDWMNPKKIPNKHFQWGNKDDSGP